MNRLPQAAPRCALLAALIGLAPDPGSFWEELRVGEARIRIFGETRPCRQMDEACPGLQAALGPAWSGGAFGEVVGGGSIEVGGRVEWEAEAPPA